MLRDIPETSGRTLEEDRRHIMRLYFRFQDYETFKDFREKLFEAGTENSFGRVPRWPIRGKSATQG